MGPLGLFRLGSINLAFTCTITDNSFHSDFARLHLSSTVSCFGIFSVNIA